MIKNFVYLYLLSAFVFLVSNEALCKEKCRPNKSYYFSEFSPASLNLDDEKNYEEVYKNYEYFEVLFNKSCDEIAVKRYVKGQFGSSDKYKVNADGSINKTNAN